MKSKVKTKVTKPAHVIPQKTLTNEISALDITEKEKIFLLNYFVHLNGARAAREAGFTEKWARTTAYGLLQKPTIKKFCAKYFKQIDPQIEEFVSRLAMQARGDIGDIYEVEEDGKKPIQLNFSLEKAYERGILGNVKSIKPTKYGTSVEMYDSQKAIELIAKLKSWINDTPPDLGATAYQQMLAHIQELKNNGSIQQRRKRK